MDAIIPFARLCGNHHSDFPLGPWVFLLSVILWVSKGQTDFSWKDKRDTIRHDCSFFHICTEIIRNENGCDGMFPQICCKSAMKTILVCDQVPMTIIASNFSQSLFVFVEILFEPYNVNFLSPELLNFRWQFSNTFNYSLVPEETMNLDDFIDMSPVIGEGKVKDLKGLLKFFELPPDTIIWFYSQPSRNGTTEDSCWNLSWLDLKFSCRTELHLKCFARRIHCFVETMDQNTK